MIGVFTGEYRLRPGAAQRALILNRQLHHIRGDYFINRTVIKICRSTEAPVVAGIQLQLLKETVRHQRALVDEFLLKQILDLGRVLSKPSPFLL